MNDELIAEIKKLNKLLILLLTKDFTQNDKIVYLNESGYTPKEISELIGTTSNTVSVTINKLKKRKKK